MDSYGVGACLDITEFKVFAASPIGCLPRKRRPGPNTAPRGPAGWLGRAFRPNSAMFYFPTVSIAWVDADPGPRARQMPTVKTVVEATIPPAAGLWRRPLHRSRTRLQVPQPPSSPRT